MFNGPGNWLYFEDSAGRQKGSENEVFPEAGAQSSQK